MISGPDLVVRLHEAIGRRDVDAVAMMFHPQARFHDYLDDGEVVGRDGARAFYNRLFETLAPDIDLLSVETMADGRTRAELQVSVHDRSGHLWSDSKTTAIYTIADDLILNVELGPNS
jgi:hypothetical protein